MSFSIKTTQIQKRTGLFDRRMLIEMLRRDYPAIPDNAKVFFRVPGGGDHSNMELDLDECPVHVEYTTTEEL